MSNLGFSIHQLRGLIGLEVHHLGIRCRIVEALEDGPALVLCSIENTIIQSDQHGNPSRRVHPTYTIPLLSSNCDSLHPSFLALDLATKVDG